MFPTGVTVGLAEGIIDDTYLVENSSVNSKTDIRNVNLIWPRGLGFWMEVYVFISLSVKTLSS